MDTSPLDLRVIFRPHNIIRPLSPDSNDESTDRCGSLSLGSMLMAKHENGILGLNSLESSSTSLVSSTSSSYTNTLSLPEPLRKPRPSLLKVHQIETSPTNVLNHFVHEDDVKIQLIEPITKSVSKIATEQRGNSWKMRKITESLSSLIEEEKLLQSHYKKFLESFLLLSRSTKVMLSRRNDVFPSPFSLSQMEDLAIGNSQRSQELQALILESESYMCDIFNQSGGKIESFLQSRGRKSSRRQKKAPQKQIKRKYLIDLS
ncbi:uncharacterized protein LOC141855702 isoform X2 [Brevipalpus obovatus]|uniref:uncharacterized protein LOC141855702 isoform X2 n=1 Tax=Brevipalpus obovatus TaxID=246614 RepID=UPI003D9DF4F6